MECNEIHRILWNAMKSIEYNEIQWILHDFVFIDIDFDACLDYRRRPAGSPGAPREPSGAIWQYFINTLKILTSGKRHFEASWSKWAILHRFYKLFWRAIMRLSLSHVAKVYFSLSIWEGKHSAFLYILMFLAIKQKVVIFALSRCV